MDLNKYYEIIKLYRDKEITREDFDNKINEIIDNINTPLKEFYKIYSYLYDSYYAVPKDLRNYLVNNSLVILESDELDNKSKTIIKCALLNACLGEYNYEVAETYANDIIKEISDDVRVLGELLNYYTKTRRYDFADKLYDVIVGTGNYEFLKKELDTFKSIISGKRDHYLPASIENQEKYIKFMNKLGIYVESNKNKHAKQPNKISIDDYPTPIESVSEGFLNFVAFDVETTGIDHSKDAITEIAAIKVVNGKIVEEKEFLFQELVHPYKKSIPHNVEELTGITNEMVKDARRIWEVFPDFAEFVGDNILVGYNCMTFDSKFLVRAGRLSNLIIDNKYFDVLHMARKYKRYIDSDSLTLVKVGEALGIKNPQAHRALADAVTTAKVYLELLERIK